MRKPPLVPTKRHRAVSCVLLVGNDPAVEAICGACVEFVGGVRMIISDVAGVSTRAAQWRPFAIIVPSSILEFDPHEFAALARTVNAELVTIPLDRIADPILRNELITSLRNAYRRRSAAK